MKCNNNEFLKLCVEVLQDTAFLIADDWNKEENLFYSINNYVRIDWENSKNGFLIIGTTDNISKTITSNMLGVDKTANIVEEKKIDALKEVANILCGHVLTFLFGENNLFNILDPYLITKDDFSVFPEDSFYKFIVDGEPFVFCLNQ